MNRYNYLLFDLDGTLIDTKNGVLSCVKQAFTDLSYPLPSDDRLNGFMGPPLEQCFTKVCGLSDEQTKKALDGYVKYYLGGGIYKSVAFDGIAELLSKLEAAGYNLGVATSKSQQCADIVLKHCKIDKYFKTVVGAPNTISIPWTKKDSIVKAMSFFPKANKNNTVLIGDRKFDAYGADEVGIDSIGVLFGYGSKDEVNSCFKTVVETVDDLGSLFLS
jgi:phosphoglycolate phosphatase